MSIVSIRAWHQTIYILVYVITTDTNSMNAGAVEAVSPQNKLNIINKIPYIPDDGPLPVPPEQPAGAAGPLQHQLQYVQDCWGRQAGNTQWALQSLSGMWGKTSVSDPHLYSIITLLCGSGSWTQLLSIISGSGSEGIEHKKNK